MTCLNEVLQHAKGFIWCHASNAMAQTLTAAGGLLFPVLPRVDSCSSPSPYIVLPQRLPALHHLVPPPTSPPRGASCSCPHAHPTTLSSRTCPLTIAGGEQEMLMLCAAMGGRKGQGDVCMGAGQAGPLGFHLKYSPHP